jgi:hypothetical protein
MFWHTYGTVRSVKIKYVKVKIQIAYFCCSFPHQDLKHAGHADHAHAGSSHSIIANSRPGYYSILDPFG